MKRTISLSFFSAVFLSIAYAQVLPKTSSTLEIFTSETGSRKKIFTDDKNFEAPNWVRDGKSLLFNEGGRLYKIPVDGGVPEIINSDFADHCNNDHGISPDNKEIVISHFEKETGKSMIYMLPLTGGVPRLVTSNAPSYWHGWSPDGKTLAYCAERNGEFDIYTLPVTGGAETKLTSATGLDDGPDYSHDGKYIYFNSVRSGKMKIWRMEADGSNQEQITKDKYNDWFAHPSPDGQWIVFLSYDKRVQGHPPNKKVMIRLMSLKDGKITVACRLFGGQGTINVPSWSPDSKQFAFVSYKLL